MATSKTKALTCTSCKLLNDCDSPKMAPAGKGKKGILIIGESPSKVDDRKGLHWQGRTGRMLQRVLNKYGIDLFEDCINVNAVNCRPDDNRTPSKFEIDCCREMVVKQVYEEYNPKVILLLGASAVQSFLQPRWPKDLGGITKWRGWRAPDQDYKAWVVPTFHPAFVLRAESREYNTIWEQDLQVLPELVETDVPIYPEPRMHFIEDLEILRTLKDAEYLAFDYETNGLQARKKGSRIVSASLAVNDRDVYSFMMPQTKAERRPFIELLTDPNIKKMAHNKKFEHQWSLHRYGVEINNWYWDSMLAAHQLDNRTGITGLKFQTYVQFGVIYGDEVLPYITKTDEESPGGFNRIFKLLDEPDGKEKLLKYGAYDSHYEFKLAQKQILELDYNPPF